MSSKKILLVQIGIVISFILVWELLGKYKIIPIFLFSSPSKILETLIILIQDGSLFLHLYTTFLEVLISFLGGILLAFGGAIILYEIPLLFKILEPFFTIINSMPKVALGPFLIILFGANKVSIIIMAVLINMIVSLLSIYNALSSCDYAYIKLLNIFGATRYQKLVYLVVPQAMKTIISCLKIHISLTFIGVVMGEFLVSKEGLGYLIIYGMQIFKMNYVILGIILLVIVSWLMYLLISKICKKWENKNS